MQAAGSNLKRVWRHGPQSDSLRVQGGQAHEENGDLVAIPVSWFGARDRACQPMNMEDSRLVLLSCRAIVHDLAEHSADSLEIGDQEEIRRDREILDGAICDQIADMDDLPIEVRSNLLVGCRLCTARLLSRFDLDSVQNTELKWQCNKSDEWIRC